MALPHRNTMVVKKHTVSACGYKCPTLLPEQKNLAPNCSFQTSKTSSSPHQNPMPLKGRTGLRRAAASAYRRFLNRQETSSKLQPSSLQTVGFATAKHHATEGRTRPSACGCLCLTSLSQPVRNQLQIAAFNLRKLVGGFKWAID